MKPDTAGERLYNGIVKENPVFIQLLGICPTLAVTTSAVNGVGMGLSSTVVLALSNLLISLLRKVIPDRVRMPAFIVVVASFVTLVDFLMHGFMNSLYTQLGIYIPLIVVNCIILGRAESYASKHSVVPSFFDGLGMGLGFTLSLIFIGGVREILGSGAFFGIQILPLAEEGGIGYTPISIFVLAPGAFFILALLVVIMNIVREKQEAKGKPLAPANGCLSGDCAGCNLASTCNGKSELATESNDPNVAAAISNLQAKQNANAAVSK